MPSRIIDIAKAAEVSPSAVSLALNNKAGVSGELRRKIINIAQKMGYRHTFSEQYINENITIRLLKIAKHGHIVNERHHAFITEYLEGIETGAKKGKYKLEVSFFNRVDIEEIIESQKETEVDGFIILGTELNDHELAFFTGLRKPLVFIDTYFPLSVYDCVDMDNVDGVFKAIDHLYKAGHRSIGLVKSSYETRNFRMREFGFREAMEYFSLPVQEKFIVSVDPTFEGSSRDMGKYLDRGKNLPTAFFCMNDIIAYGSMKALRSHDFNIPEDISVIGFDDLPSSGFSDPPLTTIRVSTQQIGRRAVEKLSERIVNPSDLAAENILISGKLVIRSSVRQL
ncbi:MAG: LacI family DNA-binding transcriptional regulator [Treponema sp.]|jgi:LacI family transcriptional regulator|nr:LacI family DNA-binding transcriptional regulator [Treponema sp.]